MSLKLYFLNAFGRIKSTTIIEAENKSLREDYQAFIEIDKSDRLKDFLALEQRVTSDSAKNLKAKLDSLKFKGSSEENQLKQFNKLRKYRRLRKYYQIIASAELKRFNSLKEGSQLDRYFELEKLARKGFNKSDEQAKEQAIEYKSIKRSSDVRFFLKYPKSSVYKNYLRMINSEDKRKFEELQVLVESDEFKNKKIYLEDPNKWEKTSEFVEYQNYNEQKETSEIILYNKYKDSSAFDFLKKWELVFEDDFEEITLNSSRWKTVDHWAEKTLGQNFSQEGNLYAFANGKNIHLKGERLQIQIKNDKIDSLVWKTGLGFVPQVFDYSSDVLSSGGLFQAQYGVLEAKIKYDPNKNTQDIFYLSGEDQSVRVNLFEAGFKNQFGLRKTISGEHKDQNSSLSGLSAGKLYIFRIEWEKGKICWKINNKELYSIQTDVPDYPMHLNMTSFLLNETNNLPHNFEIDWVRFYQKRK